MPNPTSPPGTALITGAARRIGRAIALELADAGWQVAIHYRSSEEEARQLIVELEGRGARAAAIAADLADTSQHAGLIEACSDALDTPTCLINNASQFLSDGATGLDEATWDTHMSVNLKTPVFLAAEMVRNLPDESNGNIINLIDQRVLNPGPDFFSYTVSKSALWTATRTMAQALAPRIRVNAVSPGPVLKSIHQSQADFDAEVAATPLGRAASASEIATAVRFILNTPSMTGQMLTLDSGQHLT